MDRKRIIILSGIFLIGVSLLGMQVYADFKRKKSEKIRILIMEAETSLSHLANRK
jgi:hypothetical protein